MRIARHCLWIFSLQLLAQGNGAITTHRVEIHLRSHCGDAGDVISVVVGGQDRAPFSASRDKTDLCKWVGRKPDNPPFRMGDTFSVRLKGARTDCRRPEYVPGDVTDPEPIAKLTFGFKPNTARPLTVTTEDAFYVSYAREFPADTYEGSLDCAETADFRRTETIDAVAFPDETLRLRFAATRGQFDSPWVTVDKELRKRTSVGPHDIGFAHVRQTMDPGRIKENEIDAVAAPLRNKGLKKVTLEEQ